MTEDIKREFQSLACQLSPENLTCDGELSNAQANQRFRNLKLQWAELEKEVGREVSEEETWEWEIKKTGGYWNN